MVLPDWNQCQLGLRVLINAYCLLAEFSSCGYCTNKGNWIFQCHQENLSHPSNFIFQEGPNPWSHSPDRDRPTQDCLPFNDQSGTLITSANSLFLYHISQSNHQREIHHILNHSMLYTPGEDYTRHVCTSGNGNLWGHLKILPITSHIAKSGPKCPALVPTNN